MALLLTNFWGTGLAGSTAGERFIRWVHVKPRYSRGISLAFDADLRLFCGAQESQLISTHVLDISLGAPAAGVTVRLDKEDGDFRTLAESDTNQDGRISFPVPHEPGTYRLTFQIGEYLRRNGQQPFFPEATVVFEVFDTSRKYHVPLLLSPFGYSTYRGS
ncbi:MAG: hydroxyisourate hydrolase [Deltaproteobacteria bacterium]|nr:hydroxyisourate hydrolase [Deltaproteobacteria bacterium]